MIINSPIICIIVGLLCGIMSGFGIGGGSLLMIWMTAVIGMEQITAQGINLLYFLPTAAAAILLHRKNKSIEWRAILPATVAGCISSAIFAWISSSMNTELLRKLFGGFLLIVGFTEIFKKKEKGQN